VAASDFFCPNLSTIAFKLKLSESVAGVTFLAFGNGSPDLFSTFSAMTHESGPLAIGELIGAANFITSVVADVKTSEEFENRDAYGYESYDEMELLLQGGERSPNYTNRSIPSITLPPLLPYDHFERLPRSPNSFTSTNDVIDQSKHQLNSSTSSARPMTINRRPSLFRAIEV
ncbi:30900_t:CDS:2, partial [Gigaspora margarita]